MKKKFSILAALVIMLSTIFGTNVFAATSYPSISSSKYIEFKAQQSINVYKDTACKTRGTSSPAKKYNASVAVGDVCYIYKITSSYIQLNYPTSSGRRTGYIKRSDLFDKTSPEEYISSAKASVTVYKADGSSSIAKGDKVWRVDPKKEYSGYCAVMYDAKSGKRAYKMGYVTLDDLALIKNGQTGNILNSASSWQWPMENYTITNKFKAYSANKSKVGRPYHAGVDMTSANTNIYAAADGKVVYKDTYGDNGKHIVLSHTLNGQTVKTLYSHLSSFSGCPDVGKTVKKGQKIGVMGNTGYSSGPHLHFSIYTGSSNSPYGYVSETNNSDILTYKKCYFYNPSYVIKYNKLP